MYQESLCNANPDKELIVELAVCKVLCDVYNRLPDVGIGDASVITRSLPDNVVAVGNPCSVIKIYLCN